LQDLEDIGSHLKDLLTEVSNFPSKDLLVNLNKERCIPFEGIALEPSPLLSSILKESSALERKTGVASLCTAQGIFSSDKAGAIISAPIFLQHVEAVLDRSTGNYNIENIGLRKLNPFIKSLFFKHDSDDDIFTLSDIQKKLITPKIRLQENEFYLGNFDPKRYAFIRELSTLTDQTTDFSNAVVEIYGNDATTPLVMKESNHSLFPQDTAQNQLSNGINKHSYVVQGPPGTGKSQLLSNFLGNTLFNKKRTLLISEKQAGIDVIWNKIEERKLQTLCFKIPSKNPNIAFIKSLNNSWDVFQNRSDFILHKCFKKLDALKSTFDLISKVSNERNCNTSQLFDLLSSHDALENTLNIKSNIKLEDCYFLDEFENTIPPKLDTIIRALTKEALQSGYGQLISETKKTQEILKELLPLSSWSEIKTHLTKSLAYHNFNSEVYRKYGGHLNDSGKDFQLLHHRYEKLCRKIKTLSQLEVHWKIEPTIDELDILEKMYQKKKRASTLILRWWTWRKFTRTSQLNALDQIKKRRTFLKAQDALTVCLEKFHKIGVQDTNKDLKIIDLLLKTTDPKEWSDFKAGSKTIEHKKFYDCLTILKKNFHFKENQEPLNLLSTIEVESNLLLEYWSEIEKIPISLLPYWESNMDMVQSKARAVIKRNLISEHPSLARINKKTFLENIQEINQNNQIEATIFSENILTIWTEKFQELEAITRKDPRKLNTQEKEFRKSLKKGKVLLSKEFAKQRSHKTIRQLLLSEARPWIDVLQPIWMSNPSLLADHLPMEKEMFDFVVADESSQLLLSHSIGAFQRGAKSIICGDPEQMSPNSYFKKKQEVEMSLLHHAYYHLPKIFLSNHYRSHHPKLIEFSNSSFYENRLKAFQDLSASRNPIQHHFISDGVYLNRQNLNEAKAVAIKIKTEINNPLKIGVVAFSEVQLKLIHDCIDHETRIKLDKRIKDHTAFSHALENVQGDECDLLMISMGYGYNDMRKFEMRFGPINTAGGHRRLNVLFSRSRHEIHFFSSVQLKDFIKSDNPGVLMLIKWFEIMEKPLKADLPNSEISIEQLLQNSNGFYDLLTYVHVYEKRGYTITS
tara:strand:+ start:1228 stop:4479 length:3252 start_codon:yes stop_codon:yes gene_type:complete